MHLPGTYRKIYFAAGIVFLVTAWFSAGYNHFDEHFQVLEFAALKLGLTEAGNLPWEYGCRMRPAMQPFLVYLVCQSVAWTGLTDPFILAGIIRFLSAALTFASIVLAIRLFTQNREKDFWLTVFILVSFFAWFVPYNAARFSSETVSGRIFLIALAWFFLRKNQGKYAFLILGFLLGLGFVIRYQTGFMILGFAAWLVFVGKTRLSGAVSLSAGFLIALATGVLVDRWFYGGWVLTSWNYFFQNMVMDKAAAFGVSPWWYYLEQTLVNALPPLSLLLIFGVLVYFILFPKDWITWMFVPFLAAHFLIGHKEIRFLFPIIGFLPFMIIRTAETLTRKWAPGLTERRGFRLTAGAAWYLNLAMLAVLMFRPADDAIGLYRQLWNDYPGPARLCFTDDNPYHRARVDIHFYKRSTLALVNVDSLAEVKPAGDTVTLFVTKAPGLPSNRAFRAVPVYETYPAWVRNFNINNWMARTSFWHVYEMKPVDRPAQNP